MMGILDGFEPVDRSALGNFRLPTSCKSRALLEAFIASGEDCLSKSMPPDELSRMAYNLRHYRHRHIDEFQNVGIAARNGSLMLYRADLK